MRREAIRLYEIYPESYSCSRISQKFPDHDLVARIELTKGKFPCGIWQKHAFYTDEDFPKTSENWKQKQKDFKNKYFPLLNDTEKLLLEF